MLTFLRLEFLKLKGTLVWVLCLVAPTLSSAMTALIAWRQPGSTWDAVISNAAGLWGFFVLPMTVAALSALVAHIEHGPRTWDHLFALPVARWRLFTAKAATLMGLIGVMSVLVAVETFAFGQALAWVAPKSAPSGGYPWQSLGVLLTLMWAASFFMAMLQLWVALRFRSFVAPITLGLAGTFVAVAALGAPESVYVPWVMPISVMSAKGAGAIQALALGIVGGFVTFILLLVDLTQKEV